MLYPSLKLVGFIYVSIFNITTINKLGFNGKSSSGNTGLSSINIWMWYTFAGFV
jgi:hypothetical protein